MPFTDAQTLAFFTDAAQMGIPAGTREKLREEGIDTLEDLKEFDRESIKRIAESLRCPGGRIADPDGDEPAMVPTPPFVFGARSQKRMAEAAEPVRHCDTIQRAFTPINVRCKVIEHFTEQWTALKSKRDGNQTDMPRVGGDLTVLRWSESVADWSQDHIGARHIPLVHVVRDNATPGPAVDVTTDARPHSEECPATAEELVACTAHSHPPFRADSAESCFAPEKALQGTSCAATLCPYVSTKDGRAACNSIINQHCGTDEWEKDPEKATNLLQNRKWKGQGNFPLERFVSQHRVACTNMVSCARHMSATPPNERMRVDCLLNAIQNGDPAPQAAIAMIRMDDTETGMMCGFEAAATCLAPNDPVAKKHPEGGQEVCGAKRSAQVSSTTKSNDKKGGNAMHGAV